MSVSSFLFGSIFPAFDLIFVNSTCNSPTLRRSEFNFCSSSSCEIDFSESFFKDSISFSNSWLIVFSSITFVFPGLLFNTFWLFTQPRTPSGSST